MGRLTSVVNGRFLAFDTSPLIYYIEQHHAGCEILPIYVMQFNTVEFDCTYYRIPRRKLVQGRFHRTARLHPPSQPKFPRKFTHQKPAVDCERETAEFLCVMELLGERLAPLLLHPPSVCPFAPGQLNSG